MLAASLPNFTRKNGGNMRQQVDTGRALHRGNVARARYRRCDADIGHGPSFALRQPQSRNVQKPAIVFSLVKEGCAALVRSAMMASRTAWRVAIPVLSLLLLGCSLLSTQHYTRGVEEVPPCHYMVPICACVCRADSRLQGSGGTVPFSMHHSDPD